MSRDARALSVVHRFGTGGDNVALTGVRVLANPFEPAARTRVIVSVRNHTATERDVQLEVAPLAPDAKGDAVERNVKLAPGATETVSIDGFTWTGPFRVALSPDDDLPLDDTIYGAIPVPATLRVLLVTEDDALQRAFEGLARSLGNVQVRTLRPVQYQPESAEGVTIFDRFAPPLPPSGNVAYLAPPRGNADVTVAGAGPRARFAEQRAHQLVAGVANAGTLLGDEMVALAASGTLKPVLLGRAEGREVPLLLAGEVGGRRIVATSFPLRAGDLRSADALPTLVFAINLLRWLSPASGDAPLTRLAGERLRAGFPDASPIARIEGPGGTRELGPSDEVTLEHAGVYKAVGADRRTRPAGELHRSDRVGHRAAARRARAAAAAADGGPGAPRGDAGRRCRSCASCCSRRRW